MRNCGFAVLVISLLAGCSSATDGPLEPPPPDVTCSGLCGSWVGESSVHSSPFTMTFASERVENHMLLPIGHAFDDGRIVCCGADEATWAAASGIIPYATPDSVIIGVADWYFAEFGERWRGRFVTPDSIVGYARSAANAQGDLESDSAAFFLRRVR